MGASHSVMMLRLDPGDGRVNTARQFNAWEGDGEYNVARGTSLLRIKNCSGDSFADNPVGRLVEDHTSRWGRYCPYTCDRMKRA